MRNRLYFLFVLIISVVICFWLITKSTKSTKSTKQVGAEIGEKRVVGKGTEKLSGRNAYGVAESDIRGDAGPKMSLAERISLESDFGKRRALYISSCRGTKHSLEELWKVGMESNFGNVSDNLELVMYLMDARGTLAMGDKWISLLSGKFGAGSKRDKLVTALMASIVSNEEVDKIDDVLLFGSNLEAESSSEIVVSGLIRGLRGKGREGVLHAISETPSLLNLLLADEKSRQGLVNLISYNKSKFSRDDFLGNMEFIASLEVDNAIKDEMLLKISSNGAFKDPFFVWESLTSGLIHQNLTENDSGALNNIVNKMRVSNPEKTFDSLLESEIVPAAVQVSNFSTWIEEDGRGAYEWYSANETKINPKVQQGFVAGFAEVAISRGETDTAYEWLETLDDGSRKDDLIKKIVEAERSR